MVVRPTLLPAFGTALAALLLVAALAVVGRAALALPVLVAGALLLLSRPVVAAAVTVGAYVLIEDQADWGPSAQPSRIYDLIPGTKVTAAELLLVLALVAVMALRVADRRPLLLPRPFTAPLGLLMLGLVAGALTGRDAGVGLTGVINAGRSIVPLLVIAFVAVQVIDTPERLRQGIGFAGALAAAKGVLGLGALLTGQTGEAGGEELTYYAAPANMAMLGFLCVVLAAGLRRVVLPTWVWVAWPITAASLLLSYRRSFWIAAAIALTVVVVTAVGGLRRRFGIPAVVIAVGLVALAFAGQGGRGLAGSSPDSSGSEGFSVQARIQSLDPSRIAANKQDRYRIGERKNVLADLGESPIAGLGLGVGYNQRYALSLGDITPEYVHFAALWWWMKLGMLGLLAYVGMVAAGVVAAWRTWRGHPDGLVRAFGLGAGAALIGYTVAETTGTFSGSDGRASLVLGAFFGLLSVAYAQSGSGRRPGGAGDDVPVGAASLDAPGSRVPTARPRD